MVVASQAIQGATRLRRAIAPACRTRKPRKRPQSAHAPGGLDAAVTHIISFDDDADWTWLRGHLVLGTAGVVGELLMAIAS